jgi:hypothetical protein
MYCGSIPYPLVDHSQVSRLPESAREQGVRRLHPHHKTKRRSSSPVRPVAKERGSNSNLHNMIRLLIFGNGTEKMFLATILWSKGRKPYSRT